ncbi:MAG: AAA family ATPase [Anaerolineae bacterium]|nr:AAA family ATPase [Anaerolineae bacterium]
MSRLSITLLGPFRVRLDDTPVTRFESDKVRGLLAYLAVEADRPHHREALAGLLWPDFPERSARTNLRNALAQLRQTIGDHQASPPFLHITRQTIQFNRTSNHWLDVAAFERLPRSRSVIEPLEEAVVLYKGAFLEGFSLADSDLFEEWVLLKREELGRQVISALLRLADHYEQQGQYEPALAHVWRLVELERWHEESYRQLMRLLALSGRRSEALAQYETCRRILLAELGVEVTLETKLLYEQIRDGQLGSEVVASVTDSVVTNAAASVPLPASIHSQPALPVVARDGQLAQLDRFLSRTLAGQGGVIFVTGNAGSGKTTLIQAFARQAQQRRPELIAAGGYCNAYTGLGDPYLPFCQILRLLTGDFEVRWALEAITEAEAQRLWQLFPFIVQTLISAGPDLVDTFLSGRNLMARASAYAAERDHWFEALQQLTQRKQAQTGTPSPQQSALFDQVARLLRAVARTRPLVLILDDLQWADAGSVSLLFHLGRQLRGDRVLIVGAFRPEEVSLGRDGARHPLQPVLHELQLALGDITIALDQGGDRTFVPAYLASEPNRLTESFRAQLYRISRGHPLFTIELLRDMRERGHLIQDETGHWVESPTLDWTRLPARVEAAIAERMGRLSPELRQALKVASVEGETFTAEVVAQVQDVAAHQLVRQFSEVLEQLHYLISSQGSRRLGRNRLSPYQFRHNLFQTYLYHSLTETERVYLHELVGLELERLHGPQSQEIAGELARHFEAAGLTDKAIPYFRQAGDRAMLLSAHELAIEQYRRGLTLLEQLPDTPERAQLELGLQLGLSSPLIATKGFAAPEVIKVFARTQALSQQMLGSSVGSPELFPTLFFIFNNYFAQGNYHTAREWAQRMFDYTKNSQRLHFHTLAGCLLGSTILFLGQFTTGLMYLEQVLNQHDSQPSEASPIISMFYPRSLALIYSAWLLSWLGYGDQARHRSQMAIALARQLDQPYNLAHTLAVAGLAVHLTLKDWAAVQAYLKEVRALLTGQSFPNWLACCKTCQGRVWVEHNQIEQGIVEIEEGLLILESASTNIAKTFHLYLLTEAHHKQGDPKAGLQVLTKAFGHIEQTDERCYEAELYRLKGELLLQIEESPTEEVEACFEQAIAVAQQQEARLWELRATVNLAKLWQRQGKHTEARQRLAVIYDWFTEGFDTADLQEAEQLLNDLSV